MLKKQAVQIIFGNFVYLVAQWAMTVVVVRLSNDLFMAGILALAATITNVFYILACYGMRAFQVSDVSKKYLDQTYTFSRLITILLSLAACAVYSAIADYDYRSILAILLYMGYKSFEAAADVYYGIFQVNDRFDYVCISMTLKGLLSITVFSILLILGLSIHAALLGLLIVAGLIFIFYDLNMARKLVYPLIKFDKETWVAAIKLLRESFLMVIILLAQPLLMAIPRLIFERSYSTDLLGAYSSVSAPTVIITTFVSSAMMPFIPLFAQYYNEKARKKLLKLTLGSVVFALGIGVVVLGACTVLGKWILLFLYNKTIAQYSDVFNLVIIVTTQSAIVMCLNSLFIALRRLKSLSFILMVGCIICYLASPYLISTYAMYGVTYALMIAQTFQITMALALALLLIKRIQNKPEDNIMDIRD